MTAETPGVESEIAGRDPCGGHHRDVQQFVDSGGPQPCLTAILVGEDPASQVYVRNKGRACEKGRNRRPHPCELPADYEPGSTY